MQPSKVVKWGLTAAAGTIAIGVIGIATIAFWVVGTKNSAIDLENQFVAAKDNREVMYDKLVKTVQEKFAVANIERSSVIKIMEASVAGRKGGDLFKVVKEQPGMTNLDSGLYRDVVATIEGQRDQFARSQQVIMQIVKEHKDLRMKIPSCWIVGSRPELIWTVVSSTGTKDTMNSGVDDRNLIESE